MGLKFRYLLTYLLTPWSRVLLEKLTGSAASQEIPRILWASNFVTYLLTPWSRVLLEKLTGSAASQEIPRILCNPKVHYCFEKRTCVLYLSGTRPIPSTAFLIFKTHFNIIIPSMPGSSKSTLSTSFPNENPVRTSGLSRT